MYFYAYIHTNMSIVYYRIERIRNENNMTGKKTQLLIDEIIELR